MAEEKDTKMTEVAGRSGPGMRALNYTKPTASAAKVIVPLVRADNMIASVQLISEGGENNLHSHTGMDGFWFVLSGRVRFYGEGNKLFGEYGPREGVFVPRDTPYWFESAGSEPLELLQVEAIDRQVSNRRVNHEPRKESMKPVYSDQENSP